MNQDDKQWAMLTHLAALLGILLPIALVLGPTLVWFLKRQNSAFIDDQGKEVINFQSSVLLVSFVLALLSGLNGLFLAASAITVIAGMVFAVIGGLAAKQGKKYRYPFAIRLLK